MCHPIHEFCCCPQVWHHHISSQIPWSHPVRSLVVPGATAAILRVLQRLGLLGGHRSWDTAVRNDQFHIRSDTSPDVAMVFPTKTERQVPSKSLSLKSSYCGWKKSCTTLDGWNPINSGINHDKPSINWLSYAFIMFHHGISRPCWGLRCNLRLPTLPADRAAATHCADCVAHRDRGIWQRAPRKPRKVGELGSRKWTNARDFLLFEEFAEGDWVFCSGLNPPCVESLFVPLRWQIPVFSPERWRLGIWMCHQGVTSWASSQPFERWRGVPFAWVRTEKKEV